MYSLVAGRCTNHAVTPGSGDLRRSSDRTLVSMR